LAALAILDFGFADFRLIENLKSEIENYVRSRTFGCFNEMGLAPLQNSRFPVIA
jgi:hypothetical protein